MLCIIQPGAAFGGNWTDFEQEEGFFHKLIQKREMPRYLLHGGHSDKSHYATCCWRGYSLLSKLQSHFIPEMPYPGLLLKLSGEHNEEALGARPYRYAKDGGKKLRLYELQSC